ncbi:hypothetical protein C2U36_27010, partial [Escherichia coli]
AICAGRLATSKARGFLIGGTSGRTTLNGEGLQHLLLDVRLPAYWAICAGRLATSKARGFLIGGTSGRTTLNGEGLQ